MSKRRSCDGVETVPEKKRKIEKPSKPFTPSELELLKKERVILITSTEWKYGQVHGYSDISGLEFEFLSKVKPSLRFLSARLGADIVLDWHVHVPVSDDVEIPPGIYNKLVFRGEEKVKDVLKSIEMIEFPILYNLEHFFNEHSMHVDKYFETGEIDPNVNFNEKCLSFL